MNIFLIGMPGSGKSTVGKKIAARLSLNFIDLDHYIEKKIQKKIQDIFSDEGEMEFRKKERDCLSEILASEKKYLLALGGGTPCYFDNLEKINSAGLSVYIEMPAAALVSRILQGAGERPLFAGLDKNELLIKVNSMISDRERFYSGAAITVHGIDLDIDDLADLLKLQDRNFNKSESAEEKTTGE
jgi:shikimate kinase